MYHRWAALAFVLALCAVPTEQAAGQQSSQPPRGRKQGVLGQNFPNPFNPQTRIPFEVVCGEAGGNTAVVSLQVYNVISQLVAVPRLEGEVGLMRPLSNLTVPCGPYVAFWDGKTVNGREAASGVVTYVLTVNGQRMAKKAFIAK